MNIHIEFFRKPLNNFFEKERIAELNKEWHLAYDY